MADIDRQIAEISKNLEKYVASCHRTIAQNRSLKERASKSTEAAMYLLAPRGKTGNLRKSIKFLKFRRSLDAFIGPDYNIGPHAHLVNNGFIHYKDGNLKVGKGENFIQRDYELTKETVLKELTRLATKELEKIGRKLEVKP